MTELDKISIFVSCFGIIAGAFGLAYYLLKKLSKKKDSVEADDKESSSTDIGKFSNPEQLLENELKNLSRDLMLISNRLSLFSHDESVKIAAIQQLFYQGKESDYDLLKKIAKTDSKETIRDIISEKLEQIEMKKEMRTQKSS